MFCVTSNVPLCFCFNQTGLPSLSNMPLSFSRPLCMWCPTCQINPLLFFVNIFPYLQGISLTLANSHSFLNTHRRYCLITPFAFHPIVSNFFSIRCLSWSQFVARLESLAHISFWNFFCFTKKQLLRILSALYVLHALVNCVVSQQVLLLNSLVSYKLESRLLLRILPPSSAIY